MSGQRDKQEKEVTRELLIYYFLHQKNTQNNNINIKRNFPEKTLIFSASTLKKWTLGEGILQNMEPLTFHPGSFHPLELGSGMVPRWNSCRAARQLVSNLPSHYKPPSRRSNPDLGSWIFDVLYPIKRIFVSRPPPFQMFFFLSKSPIIPADLWVYIYLRLAAAASRLSGCLLSQTSTLQEAGGIATPPRHQARCVADMKLLV